jgi:hypothetical protein
MVKKTSKTKKTAAPKKSPAKKKSETFQVKGEELLKKVKEIIKEGNVRKITILDKKGNTVLSVPMTVGVVGAVLAPILAAIGALAALITECTIKVER